MSAPQQANAARARPRTVGHMTILEDPTSASKLSSSKLSLSDMNLSEIRELSQALSRIPGGLDVVNMSQRLGFLTANRGQRPERTQLSRRFSALSPAQLSDQVSGVAADLARIHEILGVLSGIDSQLKVKSKSARARARAASRKAVPADAKMPTKAELDDLAEEDPGVIEVDEQAALIGLLVSTAVGTRDALLIFKEALSREITYRVAQLDARVL